MTALFETHALDAGYGAVTVVSGLDIAVSAGEVVALLGPNGAGKTTTLMTMAGVLPALGGTVCMDGQATAEPLHRRVRRGMAFVTEERSVFMRMSTFDNLRLGRGDIEAALLLFPELKTRLNVRAGLLSGGEQQMLTLARALSRQPRVLLADELSLGLAPMAVARLLEAVRAAANGGVGVILVEQHVAKAMEIADRVYVMRRGQVVLEGSAAALRGRLSDIEDSYLSGAAERV